jgi:hypothetical protein
MRRCGLVLSVVVIVLLASTSVADAGDKLRVLFIGNSLTYTNDLPAIVAALAKSSHQKELQYQTVAFPNYSLEDHWNQGDARRAIAGARWDVVVLQQGPSSLPESRWLLREYVRKFDAEIRRAGARPALYMVWPAADRERDFDRVIESHRLAAADVDGILLPVGVAWQAAFKSDSEIGLYGPDRFHPSKVGSFLAAWIVFAKLYAVSTEMPAKLNAGSTRIELQPPQVSTLRAATSKAMKN